MFSAHAHSLSGVLLGVHRSSGGLSGPSNWCPTLFAVAF